MRCVQRRARPRPLHLNLFPTSPTPLINYQGMINGTHFLITCPIDMYSVATVEISRGDGTLRGPEDSPKACRAVQATLEFLGETGVESRLSLNSRLPHGKGMASSTADVAAAVAATAAALCEELSPAQLAEIALGVEPSDGVMFPDIAIFDHREGRITRSLGRSPPMRVLILDFGGIVDTLEFNQIDRLSVLGQLELRMVEAVALIEDGIRTGDPRSIGRGATISALANRQVLFNPYLESTLELAAQMGAVGVNVAHSGTVIGMLFTDDAPVVERAAALARQHLPDLQWLRHSRIVRGGVKLS